MNTQDQEKTVWTYERNDSLLIPRVSYDPDMEVYFAKIPGVDMGEVTRNYGRYKSKASAIRAVKNIIKEMNLIG